MSSKPNRTVFFAVTVRRGLDETKPVMKTGITLLLLLASCSLAGVRSVPLDYPTIQAAIDNSNDGDVVLVAPGTYTGPGNRDIDFYGKAITVKSKEGPQTCIIDCQGSEDDPHKGFIFHTNEDANSILQGFTITHGYDADNIGGGISCDASSPCIKNCVVTENAAWLGGGIGCRSSNVVIANCIIIGNRAEMDRGGGIFFFRGSPHILDCLIANNSAFKGGGGVKCESSNTTFSRCIIRNNSADFGGGIDCRGDVTITNCFIIGNKAERGGGGIYCFGKSDITVTNCIINGNKTEGSGGGIYCNIEIALLNCTISGNRAGSFGGGGIHLNAGRICNSIIYGNTTPAATGIEIVRGPHGAAGCRPESIKITNSIVGSDPNAVDIPRCYSGEWLHADPLFAQPGYWDPNGTPDDPNDDFWVEGDYHLKSQAGRWDPNSHSWVQDEVTSPCIDAGDPNSQRGDEIWPHGGRINMGAYGGTPQASMSAEPQAMSLPRVAYVHHYEVEVAEGYQALLTAYGCPTTLIPGHEVATTPLDDYDLIIAGTDTGYSLVWADEQNVTAVEGSGKPVVGLGKGGYWYFGYLGLTIGRPNGGSGFSTAIEPVDPDHPLFSEPYPIDIPADGVLELCAETAVTSIYLYPAAPDTVTTLGLEAGNPGYYPLVLENDRYLFWGFEAPAESLTETGRKLFANVVIRAANAAWATDAN